MSSESTSSTETVRKQETDTPVTDRKSQMRWILATFAIVLILDQVTKAIIMETIELSRSIQPDVFFQLTHQRNEGLVGGLFSDSPILPKLLPLLATGVLLFLFRYLDPAARIQAVAYGLVAGGAVGNLVDRVRLGSVTDFLQFHFYFIPFPMPWKLYPAFNIADSGICVGVVILILTWNLGQPPKQDAAGTL